ncbi:hypothetical protein KY290_018743 [Solanum tuberosum]|uniref:Uncharacterized protein n=1 Tax=Solanum tuberosum TaxID=4113 RepID=A0ABQ7VI26_SOLTU|nr:hypothetical protein KY290_018743 [Solanum tuberosum]
METFSIRKTVLFVQIWIMLNVSPSMAWCRFPAFSKLQLPLRTIGPEASAFDRKGGGPHTGPRQDVMEKMGQNFGLGFYYRTGDLYITDAFYGLVVVGPSGGLITRVTSFQGRHFAFLDALDIDQNNRVVYFVDSGAIFLTGLVAQKLIFMSNLIFH